MRRRKHRLPEQLSTGQVARLLGISTRTVYRWEARGYLVATMTPAGQRRFRTAEIMRILRQRFTEADDRAAEYF